MSTDTKSKVKGFLVVAIIEALLLMFVIHYGNYSNFASTDENTEQLVLQVDEVKRPGSVGYVYIYSSGTRYKMQWSPSRSTTVDMGIQKFYETVRCEETVIAYVRNGLEVVGLQGKQIIYLTVEDYNSDQKESCMSAWVVYAIFQLIHAGGIYLYIRIYVLNH